VRLTLRLTTNWPVCLGVGHPTGAGREGGPVFFSAVSSFRAPWAHNHTLLSHLRLIAPYLYPPDVCYHSFQNLLSPRLLSKNLKIRIYRTIILPVVLYGRETWSLTVRKEEQTVEEYLDRRRMN
jgi:hypothetical protein